MSLNAKHTHPVRRMLASVLAGAMLLANLPAAAFAAGTTADSDWKFAAFGTSSSAAVNTLGEGSSISGTVKLNACTVKPDGSIDKKGGKFVADAPADGLSFYYTEFDPTKENFSLLADVTLDYINPTPDGQEGFALMVRDTLSGSGSYFSNQFSVTGTMLPLDGSRIKDGLGARGYTGIVSNESAASNDVKATLMAFSAEPLRQGDVYRLQLEKADNRYTATQYEILPDGSTGKVVGSSSLYIPAKDPSAVSVGKYAELADPMTVQEANKAYVGFAAARGVQVTFSNIQYKTSAWSADGWTLQPTHYIDPSYRITSPSTCAEEEYTLVFQTNADGKASVYANGQLLEKDLPIQAGQTLSKPYPIQQDTTFQVKFTPAADFAFSAFEKLSDYGTKTVEKAVSLRTLGENGVIHVSPAGTAQNNGTAAAPTDLATALAYASAGQTVLLESGVYPLSRDLVIQRGRNGRADAPITVTCLLYTSPSPRD